MKVYEVYTIDSYRDRKSHGFYQSRTKAIHYIVKEIMKYTSFIRGYYFYKECSKQTNWKEEIIEKDLPCMKGFWKDSPDYGVNLIDIYKLILHNDFSLISGKWYVGNFSIREIETVD